MATPRTGRPRGRPPGAKNLAKTLDGIVLDTLAVGPLPAPYIPPPPFKKPKGVWAGKTKEQRSAYAKAMAANRLARGINCHSGRKTGVPYAYTAPQYALLLAQERPKIARIMSKMAAAGELPDDALAVESLTKAVEVLRTAGTNKDKLAAASLILSYTKARPTTKIETTIRTAEDYLDELGADGTN